MSCIIDLTGPEDHIPVVECSGQARNLKKRERCSDEEIKKVVQQFIAEGKESRKRERAHKRLVARLERIWKRLDELFTPEENAAAEAAIQDDKEQEAKAMDAAKESMKEVEFDNDKFELPDEFW